MSHSLSWLQNIKTDDIDGGLAADFDGSLSGLGVELGSSTYNMSEALLALPVFKQESLETAGKFHTEGFIGTWPVSGDAIATAAEKTAHEYEQDKELRFQCILGAATSPATKMYEETLTYLNQGQSYEIKLKKYGDTSDLGGKSFRSVVRVIFHDRRLQFMEREQINLWKNTRPGERLLEIDLPLSYGIHDVKVEPTKLNSAEFKWEPNKDAGVFIRVHCISTEFTAKKHGGEKGVPFRVQVETYVDGEPEEEPLLLQCASCQIKVFKPKGADRKHKTDREKMEKRSEAKKKKVPTATLR